MWKIYLPTLGALAAHFPCKMALSSKAPVASSSSVRRTSAKASARPGSVSGRRAQVAQTTFSGVSVSGATAAPIKASSGVRRAALQTVAAIPDGAKLDRKLRVAVIGGGPSGACAAETLAEGGVETFMFERKLDNCKVRSMHTKACDWGQLQGPCHGAGRMEDAMRHPQARCNIAHCTAWRSAPSHDDREAFVLLVLAPSR